MTMTHFKSVFVLISSVLFITACGSGSDEGGDPPPPPQNQLPQANAGPDQSVDEQVTITLAGSGTDADGTISTYSWAQISGQSVTLTNADTATASFDGPTLTTQEVFSFQLTVTDNSNAAASDTLDVTISPVNTPPTVDAGQEQSVFESSDVTLTSMAADSDGTIDSYLWVQTNGKLVTLSLTTTASTTFVAPEVTSQELLTFQVTVTDNEGAQASSDVTVIVDNAPLVANKKITIYQVGKGTFLNGTEPLQCSDTNICEIILAEGESITLEAVADNGYTFDQWNTCAQLTGNSCTLTYESRTTITAAFIQALVLKDNVIELNALQISGLQNYVAGSNELLFDSAVDDSGFIVGNILVADQYSDIDSEMIVFAERIVDVQLNTNGLHRIRVLPATIDDVVKSGAFSQADIALRQSRMSSDIRAMTAIMASGKEIPMSLTSQEMSSDYVEIDPSNRISTGKLIIESNNPNSSSDDLTLEVIINGGVSPFFTPDWGVVRLQGFLLGLESTLVTELIMTSSVGFVIDKWEYEGPIKFRVNFPCYPLVIGICLNPVFEIQPNAEFTITTPFTVTGTLTYNSRVGMHYIRNNGFTSIFEMDIDLTPTLEFGPDVEARVEGGLNFKFELLFNKLAGPNIFLNNFVAFATKITSDINCQVDVYSEVGVRVSIGGTVKIIDADVSLELAEWVKQYREPDVCIPFIGNPTKPVITFIDNDGKNITLQWNQNKGIESGITYEIYSTTVSSKPYRVAENLLLTQYLDPINSSATEYCYTIVASNYAGLKSESDKECVASVARNNTPPSTPLDFAVQSQDDITFTFNWSASTDDIDDASELSYTLYESNIDDGRLFALENTSQTELSIVPNRNGQSCYFVIATDSDTNSSSASELICVDALKPPANEQGVIFSDDFNRPDSVEIGNGWQKLIGGSSIELINGEVQVNEISPDELALAGIYRRVDYDGAITIRATLHETNGFGGLSNRHQTSIGILGDGTPSSGYQIRFSRSDINANNSQATLFDSGNLVQTIDSSFQFGSSIDVEITFYENGSISGAIIGEPGRRFGFSMPPRDVLANGDFVYFEATKPDLRDASVLLFHRLDDFAVVDASLPEDASNIMMTDTGITDKQCFSILSGIPIVLTNCDSEDALLVSASQDGMRGRDVTLNEASDGALGFSYSQVTLPNSSVAPVTDCVKDNITDLIWEGKPEGGQRAVDKTYSIVERDTTPLASEHIDYVNSIELCGYSDWRLPSTDELLSLFNFGDTEKRVDVDFFPFNSSGFYWSSEDSARTLSNTWAVSFVNGRMNDTAKIAFFYVRAVRGDSAPVNRFEIKSYPYLGDAEGNVAKDIHTGVSWRRCSEGQIWDGTTCAGNATGFYTLLDAFDHTKTTVGWRVPNVKELSSIHDKRFMSPAIDSDVFPGVVTSKNSRISKYWVSTPDTIEPSDAVPQYYFVQFNNENQVLSTNLDSQDKHKLRLRVDFDLTSP